MTINLDQYPQIYNKVDIDTGFLNYDNNFDYENKSLENVSNKIRNNVIITPPLYPTTLSSACIKNGYLYPMSLQDEPYPKCKTVDDFYYPSQQINKVLTDEDDEKDKKDNKDKKDIKSNNNDNSNGSLDKVPSSRSYYELEPRFNNVIFPWRAYTWTYPIQPNTENYFRDNVRSLSPTPAYIPNLDLRKGTSGVKIPKLEKFNNISNNNNKCGDMDPIMTVIIIILILFLLKMCKII